MAADYFHKLVLTVLFAACFTAVTFGDVGRRPAWASEVNVVIVYSYHHDFWVVQEEEAGLVKGLAAAGFSEGVNIRAARFYLDTKRANKTPQSMEQAAKDLVRIIQELAPDIVFIFDDDALRHVGGKLFDNGPPIVFGGVNMLVTRDDYAWLDETRRSALADSIDHPGHNVTGVEEKLPFAAGFELLHQLLPEAKTAIFISDDSPISRALLGAAGGENALENPHIQVVSTQYTNKFQELQRIVMEHQDKVDSVVLFLPWSLEDEDGDYVPYKKVVRWMLQNNSRPGVAYLDTLARAGYLCGMVVDMQQQGFHAGLIGGRILHGESPGDIPIMDPVANRLLINLARAQQLGVDVSFDVLKDADMVYKTMSAYPEYKMDE